MVVARHEEEDAVVLILSESFHVRATFSENSSRGAPSSEGIVRTANCRPVRVS
jgi:hypothetical protein